MNLAKPLYMEAIRKQFISKIDIMLPEVNLLARLFSSGATMQQVLLPMLATQPFRVESLESGQYG